MRYWEGFFDGLVLCMVMDYAEGGDLSSHLQSRRQGSSVLYIAEEQVLGWYVSNQIGLPQHGGGLSQFLSLRRSRGILCQIGPLGESTQIRRVLGFCMFDLCKYSSCRAMCTLPVQLKMVQWSCLLLSDEGDNNSSG